MKKQTKTIIQESEDGIVLRVSEIPGHLLNFYLQKKRTYKDGSSRYEIGVELPGNPKKAITLGYARGDRTAAIRRLDDILKNGA